MTLLATQIIGLVLLFWLLSRRIARASDVSGHLAALRAEVGGLVAELNGTTDRNVTLLEDRVVSVNALLATIDRKVRVLSRESARYEANVAAVSAIERDATPRSLPASETPPPAATKSADLDLEEQVSVRNEHMIRLHRSGLGPEQIAERLGAHVGEVELVIALAGRTGATASGTR